MKYGIVQYYRLLPTLKQAVEKKPLFKITVSELVGIFGFNRKTFYYHFDIVYSLVHWILEQEDIQAT